MFFSVSKASPLLNVARRFDIVEFCGNVVQNKEFVGYIVDVCVLFVFLLVLIGDVSNR